MKHRDFAYCILINETKARFLFQYLKSLGLCPARLPAKNLLSLPEKEKSSMYFVSTCPSQNQTPFSTDYFRPKRPHLSFLQIPHVTECCDAEATYGHFKHQKLDVVLPRLSC